MKRKSEQLAEPDDAKPDDIDEGIAFIFRKAEELIKEFETNPRAVKLVNSGDVSLEGMEELIDNPALADDEEWVAAQKEISLNKQIVDEELPSSG